MIQLRPTIFICSCNSCHAKNYGENAVDLYEIEAGTLVTVVCENCAIELWNQIADEIMWVDR